MAIVDGKGKYSFSFNPNRTTDTFARGCSLQASAVGFRSNSIAMKGERLEEIALLPFTSDSRGLFSHAEGKEYEKALNLAAKHEWAKAIEDLQRIASGPGKSAAVMLNLGVMQRIEGQNKDAEKSFLESAKLDSSFGVPLVLAAELEVATGDFQSALTQSERAIQINSTAFPEAYASSAVANAVLQKVDAAETRARKDCA